MEGKTTVATKSNIHEERDDSLILSRVLDALDLTDNHVRSRISQFSRLEVLANAVDFQPDYQNTILTGSVMDGVCWRGYMTDIDSMLRFTYIFVKEKEHELGEAEDNYHIFEMDNENVHPGYTRLKLCKESPFMENNIFSLTPNGARSYCFEEKGNFYLSSYKFKTAFNRYQLIPERPAWVMQSSYNYAVSFPDEEEILEHGPSLCFSDETKEEPLHDSVPCFHCKEWPSQALEWKTRTPRNWPAADDVDKIISAGCDVVPVGFVGSKSRHLEWRISFTSAERQLLTTFNNTQHKCYALLKMLLKDVVEESVPDVLSSFQMKNALLWTVEKTDPSIWCEERITEAFIACVETMLTFLKNGNAQSYFIPDNNVLDKRMNERERTQLTDLFTEFMKEGWKCLLRCKSLTTEPNLQTLLNQRQQETSLTDLIDMVSVSEAKSLWFQHDMALFPRYDNARLEIMTSVSPESGDLSIAITKHHMMLRQLESRSVNDFYRKTLMPIVASIESSLGFHLYSFYVENQDTATENKHEILQQAEIFLVKGIEMDAAAGKLKYATYLYMVGDYQKCKQIADEVLTNGHRLPAFVPQFLPSKFSPSPKEEENYESYVRQNEKTSEERFLSSAYHAVVFLPTEISASPPAVRFQIQTPLPDPLKYTSWLGWAVYDPLIFALYLLFLCEMKTGRNDDAENALQSIEKLLTEKDVGYEISALNLLGYSYVSIDKVDKGIPFLLQAMEKAIAPNSTVWQLGYSISDILSRPRQKLASHKEIL